MNEANRIPKQAETLVEALVDLGTAWAAHGLDAGKLGLEQGASALTKTAKTLETIARELETKRESKAEKRRVPPPA